MAAAPAYVESPENFAWVWIFGRR